MCALGMSERKAIQTHCPPALLWPSMALKKTLPNSNAYFGVEHWTKASNTIVPLRCLFTALRGGYLKNRLTLFILSHYSLSLSFCIPHCLFLSLSFSEFCFVLKTDINDQRIRTSASTSTTASLRRSSSKMMQSNKTKMALSNHTHTTCFCSPSPYLPVYYWLCGNFYFPFF